jgi:hypothetical protein
MAELVLLTAPDCHLCGHGREVLDGLAAEGALSWREVSSDSAEGRRLEALSPPLRPVLFTADGRMLAYGRLSAKRLRKALARRLAA